MHLLDDTGHPIDADLSLDFLDGEPCIVVESSGGSSGDRPRRNPQYNQLIAVLLRRLAARGARITKIYLDSAKVAALPWEDRLVALAQPYPIDVSQADLEELRKSIGRRVAAMHQDPKSSSEGNAQKRIRICLDQIVTAGDIATADPTAGAGTEDESLLPGLTETERRYMRAARLGQGEFRRKLMKRYGGRCPVTGLENPDLLIASHIKPWSACSNAERLDDNNGILLSALADRLFDKGLMTFRDDGTVVLSSRLAAKDLPVVSAHVGKPIEFRARNLPYLEYHRRAVYKSVEPES
jgi:hypothetical protein